MEDDFGFDLSDIDLEDLIDTDDQGSPSIEEMSGPELEEYVMKMGSVPLDDQGRMLISCPNNPNPAFCGLYPVPGPDGELKIDCTGPLNTTGNNVLCRYGPSERHRYDEGRR